MPMLYSILLSTRPRQWIKNIFVFPALLFSQHLFDSGYVLRSLGAALCCCLLSGAVYLFNDVLDREQDRQHPEKYHRPIAAGLVPVWVAMFSSLILVISGLVGGFALHMQFGWVALVYGLLNIAYSLYLKHVVLLDVFIVAHSAADSIILANADMLVSGTTALSNGDDGLALVFGSEPTSPIAPDGITYAILDWLGDWNGDPGQGWVVSGVNAATRDHTIIRNCNITQGDTSWANSAANQWMVRSSFIAYLLLSASTACSVKWSICFL
mgnify:CR=1 FL=1